MHCETRHGSASAVIALFPDSWPRSAEIHIPVTAVTFFPAVPCDLSFQSEKVMKHLSTTVERSALPSFTCVKSHTALRELSRGMRHRSVFRQHGRTSAAGFCTLPYVLTIVVFFVAVHLYLAAAARGDMNSDMNMKSDPITITKADQGHEIAVTAGSLLRIELPFLGSAGYGWHVEKLDEKCLELVGEETRRITPVGKVGGPVMGCWYFRTINPGRAEIGMAYYRPWEGPAAAEDRFTVTIDIK